MYYVYAIRSVRTDRLYIGQTSNMDERLARHNAGYVMSTANDRPWVVVALETFETRDEARWRERAVFARLWTSADHAEAAEAFLEKRSPKFRGE